MMIVTGGAGGAAGGTCVTPSTCDALGAQAWPTEKGRAALRICIRQLLHCGIADMLP